MAVRTRSKRARRASPLPSCAMGCGIDLVELDRFSAIMGRWGTKLTNRVFTPAERRYAKKFREPLLHLAARFAAKEAVVKAVAQILPSQPLVITQIEVRNDALGRPSVVITGLKGPVPTVMISLTHTERAAAACAIAIR